MPDREQFRRGFSIGPWTVLPDRGLLIRDGEETHVEPKVMDVLACLASAEGEVVSSDRLVEEVWDARPVGDDVITRAIAVLRKSLGDNAKNPSFVETIHRRGYRLITPPEWLGAPQQQAAPPAPSAKPSPAYYWPLFAGFGAVLIIYFIFVDRPADDESIASLAVFPFECAELDALLCYGFAEELMGQLLQAEGLRVVRSRQPYPAEVGANSIADELNVDAVILGRMVRSGHDLHVDVEIRNRRSGFTEWTDGYPGSLSDAVDIRAKLARDVVRRLTGQPAGGTSMPASRPKSFETSEAFTRGQYEFSVRSLASLYRAIDAFQETIDLDPEYGPAYVHLAYAFALIPEYDPSASRNAMYEKAINAANRGVAVDPSVEGPAQSVYGFIDHKRGLWSSAARAHAKAIASDPVYPISHQLYSRLLASTGRLQASLVQAQRAREIDPQQAVLISRLAMAYFWLDDLDNAERYFELSDAHAEYEAPIHDLAYSLFLIRKGRYDRAADEAIAGLQKYGADASWIPAVFAGIYDPDSHDEARRIVASLSDQKLITPSVEITLWALLKDGERAMRVARLLETDGELFEAELMFIPQFGVLRGHPDFPGLLDAIGMTEYWSNAGCAWQADRVVCEDLPASAAGTPQAATSLARPADRYPATG